MQGTCYSCQILMKIEFSKQTFEKYSNAKFLENSSSGTPCCSMRTDRWTDMKIIFAFRIFRKAHRAQIEVNNKLHHGVSKYIVIH